MPGAHLSRISFNLFEGLLTDARSEAYRPVDRYLSTIKAIRHPRGFSWNSSRDFQSLAGSHLPNFLGSRAGGAYLGGISENENSTIRDA